MELEACVRKPLQTLKIIFHWLYVLLVIARKIVTRFVIIISVEWFMVVGDLELSVCYVEAIMVAFLICGFSMDNARLSDCKSTFHIEYIFDQSGKVAI